MTDATELISKEGTVSQSAAGLQRIHILTRYSIMLDRLQNFLDAVPNSGEQAHTKRKLISSIKVLYSALKSRMDKKKKYDNLTIDDKNIELTVYQIIEYLDEDLRLTKIDTQNSYNPARLKEANQAKGMRYVP